jgi:hypothetical protein
MLDVELGSCMEVYKDLKIICKGRGDDGVEAQVEMRGCHVIWVLKSGVRNMDDLVEVQESFCEILYQFNSLSA